MQLFNTLSRFQWAVLLLLYVAFIPATVYAAPNASFSADRYSGPVPLAVLVDCRNSSPWEGSDRITRIEWTTSTSRLIKNLIRAVIQLETSGLQTITLTMWNAAGESNSTTRTFDVLSPIIVDPPPPPSASFEVVKTEGLTVHLKASGIQTGIAHEYRVRLKTDISMSSYYFNSEKFSIKLPKAGTYIISLYIPKKDDSGWNQLQAETVTVYEPTPMY